jgi:uncharacterized membrane protein required for colicin V production
MDQLPPNTIIGLILALFTVLGFLKNFVKFFFNLISLALGALVGLWAYNNGFEIAKKFVDKPEHWMPSAIGIAAGVLTIIIVRGILNFLSGKSNDGSQARTGGFGLPGGTFGLLLGLGIAYFMLTGVRYAGTMAELERLKEFVTGKIDSSSEEPLFAKLKDWIDNSDIGKWHQKIDFLNKPSETTAAKLAIVKENPQKYAVLATGSGGPVIYDAIPVDPAIQEAYDQGNFAALLRNKDIHERIRKTFSEEHLRSLNVERALGLKK